MQTEPTFDSLITIRLTEEQRHRLGPLVRRQVEDRKGLLLVIVAHFMHDGEPALRLQG